MQYEHYAPFYDGSGQLRFAVLMAQYLREVLARHPAPGRRALDLACGTGTLALALADDGWQVVGLDESEPMLAQARAKAAMLDTTGHATFVYGDMRQIDDERPSTEDERSPAASGRAPRPNHGLLSDRRISLPSGTDAVASPRASAGRVSTSTSSSTAIHAVRSESRSAGATVSPGSPRIHRRAFLSETMRISARANAEEAAR